MPQPEGNEPPDPIIEGHLIRKLKNRKRLVDMGVREEVLEEMQNIVEERRRPDKVAERASKKVQREAASATEPVVRRRAMDRLQSVSDGPLSNL